MSAILLVGTGALASLFAAQFAESGTEVFLLGSWPEALQALRAKGVRRLAPDGSVDAFPVTALSDPGGCRGVKLALVLVKSWQTEQAANRLRECLAGDGLAVTLQNGYGNAAQLAAVLGSDRVAVGVTTAGATLEAPGLVRPGGRGRISLQQHPNMGPLLALLQQAGFEVEETTDPDGLVWSKLVINAAINPLTAMLGVPNGVLLERPAARELMARLAREAAATAAARGSSLSFQDPVGAAEEVARRTAPNYSSMLQDVRRGAPTEIDAICGAVVREGLRTGVATPTNETLWLLIRALRQREIDIPGEQHTNSR